ncbi:MAG: GNAT family N-acetyltransferase [Gammaproteobacteria bacterium]|nr:GNAT family N-acetyltransferase [Gammaproteobacteria bacterium]
MQADIIDDLRAIDPGAWNALAGQESPFLRHEFLAALESSGCVGPDTGWNPCHVVLRDIHGELAGALPLYRKTNSWGEFVFDFAWADAYRQAGLRYYPKLVAGIPYTPTTGQRLLIADAHDRVAIAATLLESARGLVEQQGLSSLHILFPDDRDAELLATEGLLMRKDCQFHWHNRGYGDFDQFLGELTSVKRKKLKRERRRIAEAGITFRIASGGELGAADWDALMPLYASTFWRRGRAPYLNRTFFEQVSHTMPDNLVVVIAEHQGEPIATAICFRGTDALYGRYWGSSGRYHSLHFETCYYQGIDYCIANGISRFEPGTQGEHKIARGFVPTETWSAHWLSHPQFNAAIDDYIGREREYIDDYIDAVNAHVPYRKDSA